jgi:pimeloyl-ACP methyl ester carboxylesterase
VLPLLGCAPPAPTATGGAPGRPFRTSGVGSLRANAGAALADFRSSIGVYPSAPDLATVAVPVVCSYGARSPLHMARLVRALAAAMPGATTHVIEGAGHAAPFDAPSEFVELIAGTIAESRAG